MVTSLYPTHDRGYVKLIALCILLKTNAGI